MTQPINFEVALKDNRKFATKIVLNSPENTSVASLTTMIKVNAAQTLTEIVEMMIMTSALLILNMRA